MSSRSIAGAYVNARPQTSTQRSLLVMLWLALLAALHRSRALEASHELRRYQHLMHKGDCSADVRRDHPRDQRDLLPRKW
jgi:hypothetical protein